MNTPEHQQKERYTKVSMHLINQFFGGRDRELEFGRYNDKAAFTGFGFAIDDFSLRVLEAILHEFSNSNYAGLLTGLLNCQLRQERDEIGHKLAYREIDFVPRIRIRQHLLMEYAGLNQRSGSNRLKFNESLKILSTKKYCAAWSRLKYGSDNKPLFNLKTRKYQFESVRHHTPLLNIVTQYSNKGIPVAYDITPTVVMLDQIDNYFLLLPLDWRKQAEAVMGGKTLKQYTALLLLYLRHRFEEIRRGESNKYRQQKCNYSVVISRTDLSMVLNMPKSTYLRRCKRNLEMLDEAFDTALKAGYLIQFDYSKDNDHYSFEFNKSFFPAPEIRD